MSDTPDFSPEAIAEAPGKVRAALADLRARHKKDPRRTRHGDYWCDWCKAAWPCEARKVFDALDAEAAAIKAHNDTVAWSELA